MVKNPPANAGDAGLIPELGRAPEEGMATHSSILAWRIPWAEEPGGLQSTGSQRVGHHLATERVHTRATQRVYPQGQPGITLRV